MSAPDWELRMGIIVFMPIALLLGAIDGAWRGAKYVASFWNEEKP